MAEQKFVVFMGQLFFLFFVELAENRAIIGQLNVYYFWPVFALFKNYRSFLGQL